MGLTGCIGLGCLIPGIGLGPGFMGLGARSATNSLLDDYFSIVSPATSVSSEWFFSSGRFSIWLLRMLSLEHLETVLARSKWLVKGGSAGWSGLGGAMVIEKVSEKSKGLGFNLALRTSSSASN